MELLVPSEAPRCIALAQCPLSVDAMSRGVPGLYFEPIDITCFAQDWDTRDWETRDWDTRLGFGSPELMR